MRSLLLALCLVLATACVAAYRPPPPAPLPAQEAVNIATHYARSRGVVIDYTRGVHLDGHARWHVDLGGAGGRDSAIVLLDAYSGRVLSARVSRARSEYLPQPAPSGAPSVGPPTEAPPPSSTEPPPPPDGNGPQEIPGPPPPPEGAEAAPEPPATSGPTPTD